MPRISHYRRFTANHTWYADLAGRRLFIKANPNPIEARREIEGHARIRAQYRVPALIGSRRLGRWTVLAYQRWLHVGRDSGLLLDEITRADLTSDTARLDACLDDILGHYRAVIARTLRPVAFGHSLAKLYGDRAVRGGRLDAYYGTNAPWLTFPDGSELRPSDLATTCLVVNDREHRIDFAVLLVRLRMHYASRNPTWAALTQGDPTDINLGWSPQAGPIWFDYDTGGLNAIPGEFACFLTYQRLHGAWLTPTRNPAAFCDHPTALSPGALTVPVVHIERDGRCALRISYEHGPSPARQHVLRRYLNEIVQSTATDLQIRDVMDWLRPYLVMRLLAVYDLAQLDSRSTALCLALLAEALDPETRLDEFLALRPSRMDSAL